MTEAPALAEDPPTDGEPVRGRWARRVVATALVLGLVGGGVGTAAFTTKDDAGTVAVDAGPGPRKLTDAEALRASVMRFQNFRTQGVHVRALVPAGGGTALVEGDVDYRRRLGFAKVTNAGPASGVYQWNASKVLTWTAKGRSPTRPVKLPVRVATERKLEPRKYPLDAVLSILLQLGAAKPDERAKLQRTATFMRATGIGDISVDVVRGARRPDGRVLDYWVDANGRLKRITTRLSAAPPVTQIDLDHRTFKKFPRSAALPAKGAAKKG